MEQVLFKDDNVIFRAARPAAIGQRSFQQARFGSESTIGSPALAVSDNSGAGAEGVAFQFEVETASSQPEFAGRARDVAAVFAQGC